MPTFLDADRISESYQNGAQVWVRTRKQYATVVGNYGDWYDVEYDDGYSEWVFETNMERSKA